MNDTRKIGLLGAGYILKSHAKAVSGVAGVTLHAVCDLSRSRAEHAAHEFGIPMVFDSIADLAASDCDAVHILLPPALHISAARQLIEAGKSVLIEKPMGLSSAECRDLAALADRHGVMLGVSHNFLFMPAYEKIREAVRSGQLGSIDRLSIDWQSALPLLQFGPFNSWMVSSPENLFFELGPHLSAFAIDLLGDVAVLSSLATHPIDLPGGQRVLRHWTCIAQADRATITLNLSVTPGQNNRSVSLRAFGGVARLDFGSGIGWQETLRHDNPIFDNAIAGSRTGLSLVTAAGRDFGRFLSRTLRKKPAENPFEESIFRSISAFYRGFEGAPDARHSGLFGAKVIELCEQVVARAGIHALPVPSRARIDSRPNTSSSVLVIGGTGFIGRRLVERLVARGVGVRVLTRSLGSARIDLDGLDVELVQGSHGDPAVLERSLVGIDVVYHLAKTEGRRWQDYIDNDIEPTRCLAEAALQAGVKRFVYTGTIDSYASDNPDDIITSETPLDPAVQSRNLYARSKAACEALLTDMHRTRGLPLVILRPGIVIGAGSPPAHLGICRFTSPTRVDYWGKGDTMLPLVLVDDVADALVTSLDAPNIDGQIFLLTDRPLMSAREYVAAVSDRSGAVITSRPRPIWRYYLADLLKEGIKNAIRHPNRRWPSYHDWACKAHRARYDSGKTQSVLGWQPAGSREAMLGEGINASVDRFLR